MSVDTSRLAAALEAEKVRREREIESLQQRQSEAERGISEVLSNAVESAETQRREYENQLQSELAEHQLKAALLQQTHQPSAAASDHLEREQEVIGVVLLHCGVSVPSLCTVCYFVLCTLCNFLLHIKLASFHMNLG